MDKKPEELTKQELIDEYERLMDLDQPDYKAEDLLEHEMENRLGEVDNHPYQRLAGHVWESNLVTRVETQQQRITALEAAMNAYSHNTTLRYKGEFYELGEWPGKPEGYPDNTAS